MESSLSRATTSQADIPILDNLSSYLGAYNPVASPANAKEDAVWLLDNTAYRSASTSPLLDQRDTQPWQADYLVAYFKRNSGKDASKVVADIADKLGLAADGEDRAAAEKTIAERLQPFMQTIQPARSLDVRIPGVGVKRLGPGGIEAVSSTGVIGLGELKDGETMTVEAVDSGVAPHGSMNTYAAEPKGWMVISDIDDSIKVTMTPSPIGILRSTFVSDPTPISGMPALYAHIHSILSPTWFYLSASPYNLYPFLRTFLHTHYPPGPIILRSASWQSLSGLLASLTQGTEAYKASRMESLHANFPDRKVLCVGDSTQSDPEAYGDLCRRYPGWIRAVLIRKVVGVSEMQGTGKNEPARFEEAFRGVEGGLWRVFQEPGEVGGWVEGLKERR
ncbi:Domain of unknown function DUF2183 [Lasallia pustulata]|uniref:Phosphatidate phosphatase APP1 catalytic domain-containing protein n=1 Tax=Lasallia pustulata TaxID=136370 RepID=A0A1W5CRF7_9LECA|nr:Domain of unknown function DUF2183 [Lasallia pustulata]